MTFEHVTLGQRVLFGAGRAAEYVAAEVRRLGAGRVMVIAAERERELAQRAGGKIEVAVWFDDVVQHVPVSKAEAARVVATDRDVDLIVSVGGGSTTGLAKAVALTTGLPVVAVPTTYAGSEATNVWGMTDERTKTTGVDDVVLPVSVVYDVDLTLSLPVGLSIASGLNGLAHCVDSLWAPRADPLNQVLALEGVRALGMALPAIVADPAGRAGREQALYGCYLAGVAFASAGSGLHHKICHVLGGTFDLPHAETHAIILPHVLALNGPAVGDLAGRLATALGRSTENGQNPSVAALTALEQLRTTLDAPRALVDYGFTASDIPEAAARIQHAAPASNPMAVTEDNITGLLTNALTGDGPTQPPAPPAAAAPERRST